MSDIRVRLEQRRATALVAAAVLSEVNAAAARCDGIFDTDEYVAIRLAALVAAFQSIARANNVKAYETFVAMSDAFDQHHFHLKRSERTPEIDEAFAIVRQVLPFDEVN